MLRPCALLETTSDNLDNGNWKQSDDDAAAVTGSFCSINDIFLSFSYSIKVKCVHSLSV